MIASSSFSARSYFSASTASFTRFISRLQVSLPEASHSAQMRSSMFLALVSSGATLSAPNRKSRLWVRSPRRIFGGLAGGSTRSFLPGRSRGACAGADCMPAAPSPAASAATMVKRRRLMRTSVGPQRGAEKAEKPQKDQTGVYRSWRRAGARRPSTARSTDGSALAGLEAALRLVDDIDPALAAHDAVVAMTAAQRLQ